jgi:carotenoid cleavage dioxygenase
MRIFLSFLPWIFYFTLAGFGYPLYAAIGAALLILIFSYQELQKMYILDWCSFVFFVILSFLYIFPIHHALDTFAPLIANWVLPLVIWVTIAVRRPFTLQYAPQEGKPSPKILKVHYAISSAWAIALTILALMSLLQVLGLVSYLVMAAISVAALIGAFLFQSLIRKRKTGS